MSNNLPIIPDVKVFGGDTRACYGAVNNPIIFIVTNLSATNGTPGNSTRNGVAVRTGSFREAINYTPPANTGKLILFEVSGTIEYNGQLDLEDSFVRIAGESAPSPGITIKGTKLSIEKSDIFIQHLRVRPGDNASGVFPGYRDCLNIGEDNSHHILIAQCSFSWSIDENTGIGGGGNENMSFYRCIISEALYNSLHHKGKHSKGMIGSRGKNLGIIENYFASNEGRNPYFTSFPVETVEALISNNLMYNIRELAIQLEERTATVDKFNIIGNVVKGGPSSKFYASDVLVTNIRRQNVNTKIYVNDCRCDDGIGTYHQPTASDWTRVRCSNGVESNNKVTSLAFPYPTGYTPMASSLVEASVLAHAGARPADRDRVDTDIIADCIAGTGNLVDCVADGTIYYPIGTAISGSWTTIVLPSLRQNFDDDVLNGRKIEITGGKGAGQSRTISNWVKNTRTATVSPKWSIAPDRTSSYRVLNVCTNSAGGWPVLAENRITLDIPADPHEDSGNGYTNLEILLHRLAAEVEGRLDPCDGVVCPDICIGPDIYTQKCIDGICVADELIESNSTTCGYDPCDGVICPATCIGNDLWYQKCVDGVCVADELIESNSVACTTDPCAGVFCSDTCIGPDLWSQMCDPATGLCTPYQLLQEDSINCTIPSASPTNESNIVPYLVIGGLGLTGLALLLLSKNK